MAAWRVARVFGVRARPPLHNRPALGRLLMISTPLTFTVYPLKRAQLYARQRTVAHTSSSRAWTTRFKPRELCVLGTIDGATLQDKLDVFDD